LPGFCTVGAWLHLTGLALQWKHARRGHFYRPLKRQITARVDADVLDWLKAQGKGYQSRINAILRREMLTSAKLAK
jgi:uncharacterized protein (DUF4415 family)